MSKNLINLEISVHLIDQSYFFYLYLITLLDKTINYIYCYYLLTRFPFDLTLI
jgi:hypothetical protein